MKQAFTSAYRGPPAEQGRGQGKGGCGPFFYGTLQNLSAAKKNAHTVGAARALSGGEDNHAKTALLLPKQADLLYRVTNTVSSFLV